MVFHYKICINPVKFLLLHIWFIILFLILPLQAGTAGNNGAPPDTSDKDAFQEYEVDSPPECINLYEIEKTFIYPDSALKTGIEGKVIAQILVDKMGKVAKIGELTGPEIFHPEVRKTVVKLKFIPGIHLGELVKVWVKVPLYFKIED
jgi:outer membrane biosynthesis protein TonB